MMVESKFLGLSNIVSSLTEDLNPHVYFYSSRDIGIKIRECQLVHTHFQIALVDPWWTAYGRFAEVPPF